TSSIITLTLAFRIFPVWFYAIASLLGVVFAFFMPRYWSHPSPRAFYVIIAILVVVQQVVLRDFQKGYLFFSLDTWIPVLAFFSTVSFITFVTLFIRRKYIRTTLENRISEQDGD